MDNSPNLSNTNHDNPPKEQISSTRFKIEEFTKKFNYGEKFKIFLINILNYKNYRYENCFSILSQTSMNNQKSDISEEYLYLTHKYDIIPRSFNEQYISDQIEHYMNHNEIMLSKFKGFSMTNDKNQFIPTILTERPVNGPLSSFLSKGISISNEQKYCLIYGIAKGLEYIHQNGFIHSNLNSETVYLDENNFPKICDYVSILPYDVGTNYNDENKLMYVYKTTEKTNIKNSPFIAPKLFEKDQIFNKEVDVYSFGILMYQIICGNNYVPNHLYHPTIQKVLLPDFKPVFKDNWESSYKEQIEKCLSEDIHSRPSIEEICKILSEKVEDFLPPQISVETFLYLSDLNKKPKVIGIIDEIIPNFSQIDKQTQTIIRAAEKGHIESLEKVASYFMKGEHDLPKDEMWSYLCLKKAAELGSVNSMIEVAKMIEKGVGVEPSFLKASKIYKFALDRMDVNDPERSTIESKYKETEEKTRIIKIKALSDQITIENIVENLNLSFHYDIKQIKEDENSFELKFNSHKEKTKSLKEIKKNKKFEIFDHKNKTSLFDLLNLQIPLLNSDEYYPGKDNKRYIKIVYTPRSEVYIVYKKGIEKAFIAKIYSLANENEINMFKKEINIMAQINTPSILKYIGYCNCDITENNESRNSSLIPKATIIVDASTNLDQIMKFPKNNIWNSNTKLTVLCGIAKSMSFLHKKNITHINLQPENILLNEDIYPIICDFGMSKMQNDSSTFDIESSVYMAPELFITNPVYNEKSDVYSFGIDMYEILYGKIHRSRYKSSFCMLKSKMSNNFPDISNDLHPFFFDLIKRCCDVSIDSRPDFQTIYNILIDAIKRKVKLFDDIDFDYVFNTVNTEIENKNDITNQNMQMCFSTEVKTDDNDVKNSENSNEKGEIISEENNLRYDKKIMYQNNQNEEDKEEKLNDEKPNQYIIECSKVLCTACQKTIEEKDLINHSGNPYHISCIKCMDCGKTYDPNKESLNEFVCVTASLFYCCTHYEKHQKSKQISQENLYKYKEKNKENLVNELFGLPFANEVLNIPNDQSEKCFITNEIIEEQILIERPFEDFIPIVKFEFDKQPQFIDFDKLQEILGNDVKILNIRRGCTTILEMAFLSIKKLSKKFIEKFSDLVQKLKNKLTSKKLKSAVGNLIDEPLIIIPNEKNINDIMNKPSYNFLQKQIELNNIEIDELKKKLLEKLHKQKVQKNWSFVFSHEQLYKQMEEQVRKDIKTNEFEMIIVGEAIIANKYIDDYQNIKNKIPQSNLKECFLYHGSRLANHPRIIENHFITPGEDKNEKEPNSGYFGKGIYATDDIFYATIYSNYNPSILKYNCKANIVCCMSIYNGSKVKNLKNLDFNGKKIELDIKDNYGVYHAFVGSSTGFQPIPETDEQKNRNYIWANEYVFPNKYQIIPMYSFTVMRSEYFILWKDDNIVNIEAASYFKDLSKKIEVNVYMKNNVNNAIELIKLKKKNKIKLIINFGNDLTGKKLIEEARKITKSNFVCLVYTHYPSHYEWVKEMENVLFTTSKKIVKEFAEIEFNEKSILNFIDKLMKESNIQFIINEKELLNFPLTN